MPMDLPHQNFPELIQTLYDFAAGKNLPKHLVPNSTFWLVMGDELVGVSNIRHYLSKELAIAGGHIGIGIRPSFRKLGLGTYLLQQTIPLARELGITEIHIHCYADNQSSVKMIEGCKGVLASNVELEGGVISRYIIESLSPKKATTQ